MEFIHIFQPPAAADGPILLLLHGTGGNEHDLVALAETLLERAEAVVHAVPTEGSAENLRLLARGEAGCSNAACRGSSGAWPKGSSTSTI